MNIEATLKERGNRYGEFPDALRLQNLKSADARFFPELEQA